MSGFSIRKTQVRAAHSDLQTQSWREQTMESAVNDQFLGGKDWTDLAVLSDVDTPLGQAIRRAQRYFADHDIVAAMNGKSSTVTLTVVDAEPVFLNAAMLTDVLIRDSEAA